MPPQPNKGPTIFESYAFAQWFMQLPALTLIVLTRRDIGYRLLNPLVLIAVTGALAVIAILALPYSQDASSIGLLIFAALAFFNGMVQRIRGWWNLNRGGQEHSYYIGSSPFSFRWLPNFIRRNRRVARYADPIFWALIGVALLPYARFLSLWLVFAAACLRGFEDQTFRRLRNLELDLVDSLIVTGQQASLLEQYDRELNSPPQQPDAGVPTGLGDDIKEQIKQRKTTPRSI
jgi:hypothetical protein